MRTLLWLFSGLVMLSASYAAAQVKSDPGQLIIAPPMLEPLNADGSRCFVVASKAPFTVTGTINTGYFTAADGTQARKNTNFRLAPGASQRICTFGPYYKGQRVELVLRSLFPLFSCYTVAQGEIPIYGKSDPEKGSKVWADCM